MRQNLPGPVVLLLTSILADNSIAIMLAVPEHTPVEVLRISLELAPVEVAARVVPKVVVEGSLNGPLADEDRVGGIPVRFGEVASAVGGVVRVGAADEEVDVRVDDDVGVDVGPVGVPGLGADEAVGNGDREGLGLCADGFQRGGVVLVKVGDGVLRLAEVVQGR